MNKSDLDRYRQQGASALVDAYERLASERDAIAAHVERLCAACQLGIDMFVANDINVPNTIETMQDAIESTPHQNLNAVKRDAILEFAAEMESSAATPCKVSAYSATEHANIKYPIGKDGEQ